MRLLLASVTLLLGWSGTASAAELISPPLVAEGKRVLDCYLVNIGDKKRKVTIEVLNREGDVVHTVETTLDPFEEDVARTESKLEGRVCRFIVEGKKSQYRGSILVRESGVGAISALAAY
jgi:hypothetical protein